MEEKRVVGRPAVKKGRKVRFGLGGMRAKLSIEPGMIPENKVARWLNDKGSRLLDAQNAGYTFIDNPHLKVGDDVENGRDTLATKVCRVVGTKEDNTPLMAYLMVIDKDEYEENQGRKMEEIDRIDDAIKTGGIGDMEGRYVPKDGIKMNNNFKT